MSLLLSTVGGLAVVALSLAIGSLVAFALHAFGRGIHHPAWGLALALLLLPLDAVLPSSGTISMSVAFVPICAVLLWMAAARSGPA